MVCANCVVNNHSFAEQLSWMEGVLYVYIFIKMDHIFVVS